MNTVQNRIAAWEREQRTNFYGLRWAARRILARLKRSCGYVSESK